MKTNFLFLFLIFISSVCFSQTGILTGEVSDLENQNSLIGSNILILNPIDSSLYTGVTADSAGKFKLLNLNFGNYILKISYIGYSDQFRNIEITNTPLELGKIKLSSSGTNLKLVTIEDKAPTAVQKGDTTQYNANSYKTNPDANAEDLITKMSGITTTDGKIQAHGEDVKKVLVDGKPFFGDDPNAVLKSLPAEVIDKIQVFDQQSDQSKFTGVNDGNTTKTINIITKAGMKNGTFGRFFAGYGYDNVYKAGANINFFKGDRKISIVAQSNNINEQNFSSEDLAGVMSSSSSGGQNRGGGGRGGMSGGPPGGGGTYSRGGDNASSNFLVNTKNGIAQTHAFGINYTDKWRKNIDVSASYFLNSSDNNSDATTKREYVLPADSGQIYNESNISRSLNLNHRFNMKLEWKPDTNNTFSLTPKFSFQQNNGKSVVTGQTSLGDTVLNGTDNNYASDVSAYNFADELQFMHKFKKTGRTFSINFSQGISGTDATSNLYASNYYQGDTTSSVLDQLSQLTKHAANIGFNISYTEPLNAKSLIQLNYINSINFTQNDKRTYNYNVINDDYADQDTTLSNVFSSEYVSQKAGLAYRFNTAKINLNVAANYQVATLSSAQAFPYNYNLNKNFTDVLPSVMLKYNFTMKKSLRLMYRTQTTQPSADQLQDVLNNSNPLLLSIGNPDLKQIYEHSVFVRYSSSNTDKGSSFFAMVFGSYAQNYIANSTFTANIDTTLNNIFLARGTQLTQPVNMDGNYSLRSFITYGFPISKLKTNLNITANANYSHTPGLLNNEINFSNSQNYGVGLTFSSNISKEIDFTLSTNSSYNITDNTLNKQSNSTYLNQTSKAKINWIFLKNVVLATDVTHQYYDGLSDGYNQNYLLWNAGLGYKFLKDQKAEIRFSVNDILGQNTSIVRNTTETYIEDVKTNVLQRFYMLTFTYNIKVFNKPQERK